MVKKEILAGLTVLFALGAHSNAFAQSVPVCAGPAMAGDTMGEVDLACAEFTGQYANVYGGCGTGVYSKYVCRCMINCPIIQNIPNSGGTVYTPVDGGGVSAPKDEAGPVDQDEDDEDDDE